MTTQKKPQRQSPSLPPKNIIESAQIKADIKAKKIADEIHKNQEWLDKNYKKLSPDEQQELFLSLQKKCADTTKTDNNIILKCPFPHGLQYCVNADEFKCSNGKASESDKGCKLSDTASKALRNDNPKTCIDGQFVSEAEGGSYLSPYVPWGPITYREDKNTNQRQASITSGNNSGVTIGTGVDLGAVGNTDEQKKSYLKKLEDAGVSKETRDTIEPLLGKKRADACKALREAKEAGPIVLPQKDVELIDLEAMKSRIPTLRTQYTSMQKKYMSSPA